MRVLGVDIKNYELNNIKKYELKLSSLNVENPYHEIIANNCLQHECPLKNQYHKTNECTHKLLSFQEIRKQKKKIWKSKVSLIAPIIKDNDLIALQEVDDFFLNKLALQFRKITNTQYDTIKQTQSGYPYVSILYNSEKLELIKIIFLEKHSAIVDLKVKALNKVIRVVSAHLTGYNIEKNEGSESGDIQIQTILDILKKDENTEGCIVMGDFNGPPTSKRYQIMENSEFKAIPIHHDMPQYTNTNQFTSISRRIDFIFLKMKSNAFSFKVPPKKVLKELTLQGPTRFSDHFPVFCTLKIKENYNLKISKKNHKNSSNEPYTLINCDSQLSLLSSCIEKHSVIFLLNCNLTNITNLHLSKKIQKVPDNEELCNISGDLFYLITSSTKSYQETATTISTAILYNPQYFKRGQWLQPFQQIGVTIADLKSRNSENCIRFAVGNFNSNISVEAFSKKLIEKKSLIFNIQNIILSGLFEDKKHEKEKKIFEEAGFKDLSENFMTFFKNTN